MKKKKEEDEREERGDGVERDLSHDKKIQKKNSQRSFDKENTTTMSSPYLTPISSYQKIGLCYCLLLWQGPMIERGATNRLGWI